MKVPVYEDRIEKIAPTTEAPRMPGLSMPGVVPDAFGVGAGKAYESLGRVGEQIAAHLQQRAIDEQDIERVNKETAFMQDWQNVLIDSNDEVIQVDGKDITRKKGLLLRQYGQAKGVTEEANKLYQRKREQYLDGLTKYQYDRLAPFIDRHFSGIQNKLVTHEANQIDEYEKMSVESNLNQRISNASMIVTAKELSLAIDGAVSSAEPYYRRFDEATQKLKNDEIAQKIISSAVGNASNFQQADTLLFQVKDRISPAFYNEKRNELLIKVKKAEKQAQLEAVAARNKREEDLFSAHILQGNITKDMLKSELEAKAISPGFYQAMAHNIESIEKIGANPNSSVFNKLADFILADNKQEDIRIELLNENAKGEITDDEFKILNTFNQAVTKDTLEKIMPKKGFLQALSFWSDEYALRRPEVKAQMFKEYMQKVSAGDDPQTTVDKIIRSQINNDVIQAASGMITKNTKIEAKIKQLQDEGWSPERIKKALQEKGIDPEVYNLYGLRSDNTPKGGR